MEEQPDPKLLARLTQLARTTTGNYRLALKPWEALWEGDHPQWRLVAELDLLQYVPEDFARFPTEAIVGFLMEQVASSVHVRTDIVEEPHRSNGAFWALLRAIGIPWARARVLRSFSGMQADFTALDAALYQEPLEAAQARLAQLPRFVQFLEGVLYEGRRGQPDARITDQAVRQALEETRPLRQRILQLDPEGLYQTIHDLLWLVAQRLLESDIQQGLFEKLQREPELQKRLGLDRSQAERAQAGQLGVDALTPEQRGQLAQALQDQLPRLEEEVGRALEEELGRRLMEGLQALSEQLGQGALPPQLLGQPPSGPSGPLSPEEMARMHQELKDRAQAAGRLSQELAKAAGEMAAEAQVAARSSEEVEEGAEGVRRTVGQAPLPLQRLEELSNLAQRLREEARGMRVDADNLDAQARALHEQTERLAQVAPAQTQQLRKLSDTLQAQSEAIRKEAEGFEKAAEQLQTQAQALAQEGQKPSPGVETLRNRARAIQSQAASAAAQAKQIQSQAEAAEATAGQLVQEAQTVAQAKTPLQRMMEAAQSIAEWANPKLKEAKAQAEALAQALERLLRQLGGLQQQAQGQPDLQSQAEGIGQQTNELSQALQQLLQDLSRLEQAQGELEQAAAAGNEKTLQLVILIIKEFGQAGQQAGQIQAQIVVLQGQLDQLAQLAQQAPGSLQRQARQLSGDAKQLGMTAQKLSQEMSQSAQEAKSRAEAENLPTQEESRGAGVSPESQYRLMGMEVLKITPPAAPEPRPGPPPQVAQLDEAAKVQRESLSLKEWREREAAARKFQEEARQKRRGLVQEQLPRYRQYLAKRRSLISTARAQLFQWFQMTDLAKEQGELLEGELDEEALALVRTGTFRIMKDEELPGRAKWRLSLLVDVSSSMEEEEKLDHVLDLLIVLAEAVRKRPGLEIEISIFSDWRPQASRVVKRFDEPWSEAKATEVIDLVLNSAHGGTNDVGAVREEVRRLREGASADTRLMLWVLSDGLSGAGGGSAMAKLMTENKDVRIFGWGLGPEMAAVQRTYGPYGIAVPKMTQLVRKGLFVLNREMRRPVRAWEPRPSPQAGLEEDAPKILTGHTDWVRAVAFSPDGQVLASGGGDETVRLWPVGRDRGLFQDHSAPQWVPWAMALRQGTEPGDWLSEAGQGRLAELAGKIRRVRPDFTPEAAPEAAVVAQLQQELAQLEAADRLAGAAKVPAPSAQLAVPVLAGLIPHSSNLEDIKLLDQFAGRWDAFLQVHPKVKQLVVVQELGAPFLNDLLETMGVKPGQLAAQGQVDPQGVDRVVRPAFYRASNAGRELINGWISELQAGRLPQRPLLDPWRFRLFEHLLAKRRQGFEVRFLVEEPSFESWWQFLLAAEREKLALLRVQNPSAESQVRADLVSASQQKLASAQSRDDAQINGQLVPALAEMLSAGTVDPETLAVIVPRGRMHALRTEALLRRHFSEVEVIRGEDLDPAVKPRPIDRYVEALAEGDYNPGEGPPEIKQLPDKEIAELRARTQAGLEDMGREAIRQDLAQIASVLSSQVERPVEQQMLLGIGPAGLASDGPALIDFLDRLKNLVPALDPLLVVIGQEAPLYASRPSVLITATDLQGAAQQLSLLGAGQMMVLDTQEGVDALDQVLQSRGIPITVSRLPARNLLQTLTQILGNLAGLGGTPSQSEVEAFYGVSLNRLADHLKQLAQVGV